MPSEITYQQDPDRRSLTVNEREIEADFIEEELSLKHAFGPHIHDRTASKANFRQDFEALNRVRLTDAKFVRLLGDNGNILPATENEFLCDNPAIDKGPVLVDQSPGFLR